MTQKPERGHPRSRTGKRQRTVLIVGVIVVILVVGFYYLSLSPSSQIVQDWTLKLTFHDTRTGLNYTAPPNIGVAGGIWANHTLDTLGPSGFAPISTRDRTGTIFVQSNQAFVPRFGDFFNIWGVPFDQKCVPNLSVSTFATYCTSPAEAVVYDFNGDSSYESPESVLAGAQPPDYTALDIDAKVKFVNSTSSPGETWGSGKTIVYDLDNTNSYTTGDLVIYSSGGSPSQGAQLKTDPKLRFVDNISPNGHWDQALPPPVMSDGRSERCVSRTLGLSKGYDWQVIIGSSVASQIPGGCLGAS